MIIKMPYGEVEINTTEEARKFVRHACDSCEFGTLTNPCDHSCECSDKKRFIAREFGIWRGLK